MSSLLQWTETCEGIVGLSSPVSSLESTTTVFCPPRHFNASWLCCPYPDVSPLLNSPYPQGRTDEQWYPRGGFQRVPASLQRIAESHGATFHFNSPVSAVLRDASGRATGIRLADGGAVDADVVVVNADLVWAYNNLFTKDGQSSAGQEQGAGAGDKVGTKGQEVKEEAKKLLDPRRAKRLLGKPHSYVVHGVQSRVRTSRRVLRVKAVEGQGGEELIEFRCSSISFYWAMDRQLPQLRAHNIFLVCHPAPFA